MKITMNMTTYSDDVDRFADTEDLRAYLAEHRLDGVELMHLTPDERKNITPDVVVGVHLPFVHALSKKCKRVVFRPFQKEEIQRRIYIMSLTG